MNSVLKNSKTRKYTPAFTPMNYLAGSLFMEKLLALMKIIMPLPWFHQMVCMTEWL